MDLNEAVVGFYNNFHINTGNTAPDKMERQLLWPAVERGLKDQAALVKGCEDTIAGLLKDPSDSAGDITQVLASLRDQRSLLKSHTQAMREMVTVLQTLRFDIQGWEVWLTAEVKTWEDDEPAS